MRGGSTCSPPIFPRAYNDLIFIGISPFFKAARTSSRSLIPSRRSSAFAAAAITSESGSLRRAINASLLLLIVSLVIIDMYVTSKILQLRQYFLFLYCRLAFLFTIFCGKETSKMNNSI
jgi:hypothetical protein